MIYNPEKYKMMMISAGALSFLITLLIAGFLVVPVGSKFDFHFSFFIIFGIIFILFFFLCFRFLTRKHRRRKEIAKKPVPEEWEQILVSRVSYYSSLTDEEKTRFKKQIQIFLSEKEIIPIETEVDEECRILITASALIPVFAYPYWEYDNLTEILVYPDDFDLDYDFKAKDKNVLGLVTGRGSTMILSKPALYNGFQLDRDKKNVGFHEFIHKIDGQDGYIDGIPALLADKKIIAQWLEIIDKESRLISEGKSDIDPYALTNNAEFFAVVSEYFFENPGSMSEKHPEMYNILTKIFRQDTKSRFTYAMKSMFLPYRKKLSRNAPCPCGSGKKYKHCCLKKKGAKTEPLH
ncbi:MAG: zinc-dependent peptidase [Spirochaetales bacterium]|nr:zinc-dependent peptidase [Spirochaetales bacterium]